MVLSHVGEASIKEEALNWLLDKVYPEMLDEAQIKPYGPGNLDEIKSEPPISSSSPFRWNPKWNWRGEDLCRPMFSPRLANRK